MLRLLPLLLFAALRGASVFAAPAFGLEELFASMARVPAARAQFVETKTMALLAKPLTLTGTLAYERPGKLERRVLKPHEERMTVEGDSLTLENVAKREKRTFALAANPVLWAFVESIRATLAGDRKALERFYWLRLVGDGRAWTLELEPRDHTIGQYVQWIHVAGSGNRIERVAVFETNGNRSVTRIKPT